MHRVAHEHLGVQGATAFFEGFAQPVRVGQGVIFTEETGIAVVAALHDVQGYSIEVNTRLARHAVSMSQIYRAWPL
jgi:hypothetical protein